MSRLFNSRRSLYLLFVTTIVLLLAGSQFLVHFLLGQMQADGELINDAGRMRMLSQRIVQQSLRHVSDNNMEVELCETVLLFEDHIQRVNAGIDQELYEAQAADFKEAKALSMRIEDAGYTVCSGDSTQKIEALAELKAIESDFIVAQNRAVGLIQQHYEEKLGRLSWLETVLAVITFLVILAEMRLIFIPLDKANTEKRKELEVLLDRQREISRTVAHDLRAPIGSIASIHDLLKDELVFKTKEDKELYNVIGTAAENASATASSMLVLDEGNAFQTDTVERVKLYTLVAAQIRIIQSSGTFKDRVIMLKGNKDCAVQVNIHEVSRLVQNLIENALKYSKGEIDILIEVSNNMAKLAIADEGEGMSQPIVSWINDGSISPFTGKSVSGFGLGMQFVKKVVDNHKGKLHVSSEKGKGTTITVQIPLVKNNS